MNSKRMAFIPLALVVVLLDQLAQFQIANTFEIGESQVLIENVLSLTHVVMGAGVFGLFDDWLPNAQRVGFALLSIVSTVVVASFYRSLAPGEYGMAGALGLMLGAIVSNTVDFIQIGGGIDFLHVGPISPIGAISPNRWPDFNVADVAIVLGVTTLIVELLATEMAARASERRRN